MMRRRLPYWISALAVGWILATAMHRVQASSAGTETSVSPAMPEDAQRGERLYATNCAFCHGPTGKGSATGVSLIDSSLVRHDKRGDLIAPVVREGRVDKGMPPFTMLDGEQAADIAAFLHARIAITDSVETAGPRGGYQLQHLLSGSVAAGRRYFNGEGGCSKCHSATGDLHGIASKYQPTELESRFLYPRDSRARVTVALPSGEVVKGQLQHRDAFYVSLTDGSGQYRSWLLPGPQVTVTDPLQAHVELLNRYTNKDVHDVFAYLETLK